MVKITVRFRFMVTVIFRIVDTVKIGVRVTVSIRFRFTVMDMVRVRVIFRIMVTVTITVRVSINNKTGGHKMNEMKMIKENEAYFFRTVTYHLVGRVVDQEGHFIELSDASWVADSGRFMDALKSGILKEVEPVGTAYMNLDSVVDFFPWVHELPDKQK